jgi:hypothetical protein
MNVAENQLGSARRPPSRWVTVFFAVLAMLACALGWSGLSVQALLSLLFR